MTTLTQRVQAAEQVLLASGFDLKLTAESRLQCASLGRFANSTYSVVRSNDFVNEGREIPEQLLGGMISHVYCSESIWVLRRKARRARSTTSRRNR